MATRDNSDLARIFGVIALKYSLTAVLTSKFLRYCIGRRNDALQKIELSVVAELPVGFRLLHDDLKQPRSEPKLREASEISNMFRKMSVS